MNSTRVCIFFAFISFIVGQTLKGIFTEHFVIEDYRCGDATQVAFNKSAIYRYLRCVGDCGRMSSCMSVLYDLETLSCIGCNSIISMEDTVENSTLMAFQKQVGFTPTPTTTTTAVPAFSCPPDDSIFRTVQLSDGEHFTYKVIKTFVTQWDAKAACNALGGFLARVKTVAKMNMLLDLVRNCPGYTVAEYYVDGSNANATDYYAPGAWTFVDGDPVPMSADFWGHGYPNNPNITHCLRMQNITANYKLDDCECARVCYYICEK